MNGLSSYYAVTPQMYNPPPAATPGWDQAPVPGWGTNPFRAGPERVGVNGCSSCAAAAGGVGAMPGEGMTTGQWVLLLGGVAAALYGTWWMLARYPEWRDAEESSSDSTGGGAMGRYRRKRYTSLDKTVDDMVAQGWSRDRAIKAVY
jgi:hypothetical protein